MVRGTAQQHRGVVISSVATAWLPLCSSIRVPLTLEDNELNSDIDGPAHNESLLESELARGSDGDYDGFEYVQSAWEYDLGGSEQEANASGDACQKRLAEFTKVTADAACPSVEPRMNPRSPKDILQFLHYKCDLYVPLRRCYEVIPAGVGCEANLMPSTKKDWRQFSRLFWPSQGLLDWKGMDGYLLGAVDSVSPSKGWEWLAARHYGNCYNCWSVPSELDRAIENENWYLRKHLATVPFDDIHTMLDMGAGAGNVAAVLSRDHNITVVSDNLDFGAPFLETIAARGLLSLSFNMMKRFPFVDGAFDAVHSRTTAIGDDVERFLVESDRLIRAGGYIIMHSNCLLAHGGLEQLKRTAARLSLQEKMYTSESNRHCSHTVSVVYRKPMGRHQAPIKRLEAPVDARDCGSMECLCKERLGAWELEGSGAGACPHDAEAVWHWISQHCLHLGVQVARPARCAAAAKALPGLARRARHPCPVFDAVTQMDLPLSTDALRTVLDIEGDGKLVSNLQAAYGIQGMVLSSDLHNLNSVAAHGVVGLQSSLNMRQPFGSGAFDMIHVRADALHMSFRAQHRGRAELQEESFRRSVHGDLSAPAPLPSLHELVYEIDRLVRPGGFVVISGDQQASGVSSIFSAIVNQLGWRRLAQNEHCLAFARPSSRSTQHA